MNEAKHFEFESNQSMKFQDYPTNNPDLAKSKEKVDGFIRLGLKTIEPPTSFCSSMNN